MADRETVVVVRDEPEQLTPAELRAVRRLLNLSPALRMGAFASFSLGVLGAAIMLVGSLRSGIDPANGVGVALILAGYFTTVYTQNVARITLSNILRKLVRVEPP